MKRRVVHRFVMRHRLKVLTRKCRQCCWPADEVIEWVDGPLAPLQFSLISGDGTLARWGPKPGTGVPCEVLVKGAAVELLGPRTRRSQRFSLLIAFT